MPQTLRHEWIAILGDDAEDIHADWLHQPGNLTLSAYNQELGNQAFEQKRARFLQSNIVLTRELGEKSTWNADVIEARGETMAAAAAAIWVGPKEPHLAQDEADDDDELDGGVHRHELRRKFWSGLLAHISAAHPEVPVFQPRHTKTLRLKSGVMHVGVELRHQLRPSEVAVDVYFWRDAVFPVWEAMRDGKAEIDALVEDSWTFGRPANDAHPRWMSVTLAADSDDESEWPTLFGWLGQKLAQVYSLVLPFLRSEIGVSPTASTESDDDVLQDDGPSETKRQQQRFWGVLAEAITARSTTLRPQKPLPQHWTNYAIGRAGFAIVPTVNSRDDRIGVELVIGTANAKQHFHALKAQQAAVESGLGFPVEWQELPHRNMSRVGCSRGDSAPEDESRWPEYVEWMVSRILRMEEVFRPLVRALP